MKHERLATRLDDAYDHEELASSLDAVERRLRRGRAIRRGGAALALIAAAVTVAAWAAREKPPPAIALTLTDGRPLTAMLASPEPVVRLSDGSSIALASDARVAAVEQAEGAITIRLASGSARFDVRPHGPRRWSVTAGPLTVRVLGTAFTVSRRGPRASVSVHRGVVAVDAGNETRRLYAGERFEVGAPEPLPLGGREAPDARRAAGQPLEQALALETDAPHGRARGASPEVAQPSDVRTEPDSDERAQPRAPETEHAHGARRDAPAEPQVPRPAHATAEPELATAPAPALAEPELAAEHAPALAEPELAAEHSPSPAEPELAAEHSPSPAEPELAVEHAPAPAEPEDGAAAELAAETQGPEGLAALLERADRARREGRAPDAIAALTAIVEQHPSASEAPSAAVTLAHLEERRGRLDRALAAYRRALTLDPPPSLAELCYERLVRAHLARDDRDNALRVQAEHRRRFPGGARTRAIEALLRDP